MENIKINSNTKRELEKLGSINDSFDNVIRKILDHVRECDLFWEDFYE